MSRSHRVLTLALGLSLVASLAMLPGHTAASPARHSIGAPARDDANTLTIMTCCGGWAGFTYEKRLLDFYGGVAKYTKFASGDAGVWGGYTTRTYFPTRRSVLSPERHMT